MEMLLEVLRLEISATIVKDLFVTWVDGTYNGDAIDLFHAKCDYASIPLSDIKAKDLALLNDNWLQHIQTSSASLQSAKDQLEQEKKQLQYQTEARSCKKCRLIPRCAENMGCWNIEKGGYYYVNAGDHSFSKITKKHL